MFTSWDNFIETANRAGLAWKSLLGQSLFEVGKPPALVSPIPVQPAPAGTVAQISNGVGTNTIGLIDAYKAIPILELRRADGSNTAPTAVQAVEQIGNISALGYGATRYSAGNGSLRFQTTENWTDTAQGTKAIIQITLTGTTTAKDVISANGDASTTFINKVFPGTDAAAAQTACGLYAGTGAPNNTNGQDGDYYFRSDGGLGTHIYFRSGGTWAGII